MRDLYHSRATTPAPFTYTCPTPCCTVKRVSSALLLNHNSLLIWERDNIQRSQSLPSSPRQLGATRLASADARPGPQTPARREIQRSSSFCKLSTGASGLQGPASAAESAKRRRASCIAAPSSQDNVEGDHISEKLSDDNQFLQFESYQR